MPARPFPSLSSLSFRGVSGAAVLLLSVLLTTCTDGAPPTELALEPVAMLAVNPVFSPALAVEGSADINLIRITAYLAGTDSVLGRVEVAVEPTAPEWTLDVSVVVPTGPSPQVVLTVELVNVTAEQETVQWSGKTPPITVTAGSTPQVENVTVVRGGLGNLTVTAVNISEPIPEIDEGESVELDAKATSSDPNVVPQLFWTSLDPGVGTVSPGGTLTGVAPGTVRVVATSGAAADTATTVVHAVPAGVTISPDGAQLHSLGEVVTLVGTVVDKRGDPVPGETVGWALESNEVLADLGGGRYQALARGSTVVTATATHHPTLSNTALVTVDQIVAAVDVTPETRTLSALGATAHFEAAALDANGNPIEGMAFAWSTTNPLVATVDGSGVATATGPGTVTVLAEAASTVAATETQGAPVQGGVGSATLVVEQSLARVEITPTPHTFQSLTETKQFSAKALDGNGNEIQGVSFSWSSGNTAVVTVDATGMATAEGNGTTTLTATTAGGSAQAQVTVAQKAASVALTPTSHTFQAIGETQPFTAEASDAKGKLMAGALFEWTSSQAGVVSVDQGGIGRAEGPGSATITATIGPIAASAEVTVDPVPTAMAWTVQPTNVGVKLVITPSPTVEILDANGFRVESFNGPVQVTEVAQSPPTVSTEGVSPEGVETPMAGPDLDGTTVVSATSGVAVFGDLSISNPGSYALEAQLQGLAPVLSDLFLVSGGLADLAITKTVDKLTPSEGDTVTFEIILTNLGPGTATNIVVQDVPDMGLYYISHTITSGNLDAQTQTATFPSQAPGQVDTLMVKVFIGTGTQGQTLDNGVGIVSLDQMDPNSGNDTDVASVAVAPLPANLNFHTAGNTELVTGGYTLPATPHIRAGGNLVSSTPGLTVTSVGTFATTNGGSVTMEADGDFSFTPAPNDLGPDAFDYMVHTGKTATVTVTMEEMVWYVDNTNAGAGSGVSNDPFQNIRDAYYASQPAVAPPQASGGSALEPPPTSGGPARVNPPTWPGRVYVRYGDGTPYDANISLLSGQLMEGEAVSLDVGSFGTIWPAGNRPVITGLSGDALALGYGSVLRGVALESPVGASLYAGGINGATVNDVVIQGGSGIVLVNCTGTFDFSNIVVNDVSGAPLRVSGGDPVVNFNGSVGLDGGNLHLFVVENTTGGSVTISGGPYEDLGSDLGTVIVTNVAGPVDFTAPLSIDAYSGTAITVQNSSADVTFGTVKIRNGAQQIGVQVTGNSGAVNFFDLTVSTSGATGIHSASSPGGLSIGTGSVNTTGATGININGTPFNANFSTVTVNNNSGAGGGLYIWNSSPGVLDMGKLWINTNGSSGGAQLVNAGTVIVSDPTSTVVANGSLAFSIVNTHIDMAFADVTSNTPAAAFVASGIRITNSTGTFTAAGGTISDPTTGNPPPSSGFGVGLNVDGGSADVTYGGSITNNAQHAWAVSVNNRTGGKVTLTGPITDRGRGVRFLSNPGGEVSFQGGLDLQGAGDGLTALFHGYGAAANGSVEVLGSGNIVAPSATGVVPVKLFNTFIGAGGVTFQRVSADGAANGIDLENTGGGFFTVTGDGSTPGSGGTIQNTTGDGIRLWNAQNVSLEFMDILSPAQHGINGSVVTGMRLNGTRVSGAGTDGFHGAGLFGTVSVNASAFKNSGYSNFWVNNSAGTLGLNVMDSEFSFALSNAGTVDAGAGLYLAAVNDAQITAAVSGSAGNGSTFTSNANRGIMGFAHNTAVLNLTVDGSSQPNVFTGNGQSIWLNGEFSSTTRYDIRGNQFAPLKDGILVNLDNGSTASGVMEGQVIDNAVSGTGTAGPGTGIRITQRGAGVSRSKVSGNTVTAGNLDWTGIRGEAVLSTGRHDILVLNNTVEMDVEGSYPGILLESNTSNVLCTDVRLNVPISTTLWIQLSRADASQFRLEDHTTLGSAPTDLQVRTYLEAANTPSWADVNSYGDLVQGVLPGTCQLPVLPPLPSPAPGR